MRNIKKTTVGKKTDIIKVILEHHKPLKKLIKVLKGEKDFDVKQKAFEEFAPLLISHAKPEEEVLYKAMKKNEDLRSEAFEGETEHTLADQMVEETKRTTDEDIWMAKVKVLAELVEHHIEEEESEILPDYKRDSDKEERVELGKEYLSLREELLRYGGGDSLHERGGKAVFSSENPELRSH